MATFSNNETSTSGQLFPAGSTSALTRLDSMAPKQIVQHDLHQQEKIQTILTNFHQSMKFSERLVTAAYSLADYVPPIINSEQRTMWMENIVPNVTKSLSQDVHARSVIFRSLGSVGSLVTTIKDAAELVKESEGSQDVIDVVKEIIPDELRNVEQCLEEAKKLDSAAIELFKDQTSQLLSIVGPQLATIVEEKSNLLSKANELQEQYEKLHRDLSHKKAEVERYSHLVTATQKQVESGETVLEAERKRTAELNNLNKAVEDKIQNIPVSLTKTTTTYWGARSWKLTIGTTVATTEAENPNRYADKEYYETILRSRTERIKENENNEAAREKILSELNNDLAELRAKYEEAKITADDAVKEYPDKVNRIQDQMAGVEQELQRINNAENSAISQMGLQGSNLLQCLVQVRVFAQSLHGAAGVYAPIVSFLEAVRSSVRADVMLLGTGKLSNVHLAGKRLLGRVTMLSDYCHIGNQCAQATSPEYRTIAASVPRQAIEQ